MYVSFLLGKACIASPPKKILIPCLELMVADISLSLVTTIVSQLEIVVDSITYWTDDMCVVHYIENLDLRPFIFVVYRLDKIHNHSKSCQWWYIPTDKKPADVRSHGLALERWHQVDALLLGSSVF